jgi:hypothetical protein
MEAVFENVCKVFGFQGLNKFQIEAITHIFEKGIDIFVNLPILSIFRERDEP